MNQPAINFQLITMIISIIGTLGIGAIFLLLRERNVSIREMLNKGFSKTEDDLKDHHEEIDGIKDAQANLREHIALNYIHKNDFIRSMERIYKQVENFVGSNSRKFEELHRRFDQVLTALAKGEKETDDERH